MKAEEMREKEQIKIAQKIINMLQKTDLTLEEALNVSWTVKERILKIIKEGD